MRGIIPRGTVLVRERDQPKHVLRVVHTVLSEAADCLFFLCYFFWGIT